MSEKKSSMWRYMGVAILFCVVVMIYMGRLFYIQISGRGAEFDTGNTVSTVTIQAVRGEIYDRNGNALVSNRYSYDLVLSYAGVSKTDTTEMNRAALAMFDALESGAEEGKNLRTERFFPFEGTYPNYTYSTEATDGQSLVYYRLIRVFSDLKMEKDTVAKDLSSYYVDRYALLQKDDSGVRLFDNDQIDALIRLYYDMDALRFRTTGEYTFAENLSLPTMTAIKESSIATANFRVNAERVYNYPGYASHILGTVGPIYSEEWDYYSEQGYQMSAIVGKSGCEAAFESYLRGMDGKMEIEVDASGNLIRSTVLKQPVAGQDVYLTIDITLQKAAEDGLAENVQAVVDRANGILTEGAGCNAGAAVVLDPDDFSVLAMASYPTYDLNQYNALYETLSANPAKPLNNRALNGLYEPGSTYKLGIAAAALSEGLVSSTERINCTKNYTADGYGCSTHPHNKYGTRLNVRDAIADSCNIFFYEMGDRFYKAAKLDTLGAYMKGFGIGQDTGLELGGTKGALANPDNWDKDEVRGMSWQTAIGQADTRVSPLQLACYVGTLLDGGTRYSAHLLYGVASFGNEGTVNLKQPEVLNENEIDSWVVDEIKQGMEQVVRDNNVVKNNMSAVSKLVTVGGKTGTAQTGKTDIENALFVCAAPMESPELIVAVVLEQGDGGSYASLAAARILETYYGVNS